jgi:hypothetical protein
MKAYCTSPALEFPLAPPGAPTPTTRRETSSREGGTVGEKWPVILLTNGGFHAIWRDLLHVANLRHRTDGFTSPPKEGILRIFSPWKIRRLRSVSNPRTWVPEASMLPPDHWIITFCHISYIMTVTRRLDTTHYEYLLLWVIKILIRISFKKLLNFID